MWPSAGAEIVTLGRAHLVPASGTRGTPWGSEGPWPILGGHGQPRGPEGVSALSWWMSVGPQMCPDRTLGSPPQIIPVHHFSGGWAAGTPASLPS